MNTYSVTKITDVPEEYQDQVAEEVIDAFAAGLCVSVQLQVIDEDYIELYGVYTKTEAEVADYYNSGGTWAYTSIFEI
jgi:hypothetical protein